MLRSLATGCGLYVVCVEAQLSPPIFDVLMRDERREIDTIVGPQCDELNFLREEYASSHQLVLDRIGHCTVYGRNISELLLAHRVSLREIMILAGFSDSAILYVEDAARTGRVLFFLPRVNGTPFAVSLLENLDVIVPTHAANDELN